VSTARRALACAALCAAAFTIYGSLVPFQFRAPPPEDPVGEFRAVLARGAQIDSRSDSVANVMLGVPLGFALLGALAADRRWPGGKLALVGLLLLPPCALFATAVEFSQLFTPNRTSSASDILAQTIGSAGGMVAWGLCGQAVADRALAVWRRADVDAAGRLLVAYIVLLAFIETLPFDVSASPADLYRKLRDGGVRFVPFGEFAGAGDLECWRLAGKLAKLAGLFFPVGLLASLMKGRVASWGALRIALAAVALGLCMEAPQLLVRSRSPSATDALAGAAAAVAGWFAGRVHREGLALPFALSWGVIWLALMTPVALPPAGTPRLPEPRAFDWMPGMPLESGDPLGGLEEMLTKLVLFGLLGVLVAGWRLPPVRRGAPGGSARVAAVIAAALGLGISALFEANQRWYGTHTPCISDVLLGGLGAALAVLAASLLGERRGASPTVTPPPRPAG
jgi:VanZ family protein